MKRSRVAKRYAKALFELAVERKQIGKVEENLAALERAYQSQEELRHLFESPVIPNTLKKNTLIEIFQNAFEPLTLNFLKLLCDKHREDKIPDIITDFQELLDEYRGIVRGEVASVVELSDHQLDTLKKKLSGMTGKEVRLSQKIEPALLGGFVVRIDDLVYDASLQNQLIKLKESLIQS